MQKENEIERFIAFTKRTTVADMMVVTYLLQLSSGNEQDAIAATELIARAGLSEEDLAWHWLLLSFVNGHQVEHDELDQLFDAFSDGLMYMGIKSIHEEKDIYQTGLALNGEYEHCCDVSCLMAYDGPKFTEPSNNYLVMCNVYSEQPRWYGGSYFAERKDGE